MNTIIYVSKTDPAADYSTIGAALDALSHEIQPGSEKTPATIRLDAGVYYEKLHIKIPDLTLEGSSARTTIIRYDDYAYELMADGKKRGTFFSYTLFVDAAHVTLKNLTVENASGPSVTCGQAIALYADGDRFCCINCRLIGKQDTLFVGPLPEKEYEPGGFRGPKEHAPRLITRQYYRDCYICGDVDFIFGCGSACFDHCTIHSLMRDGSSPVQGYVTAASTPKGEDCGFIFTDCLLTSDCPTHSVFLGRPWRDHAKTVFLNCTYGAHIHPQGFDDWGKKHAHDTVFFAEYNCTEAVTEPVTATQEAAVPLPGHQENYTSVSNRQQKRAAFVRQLSPEEAARQEELFQLIRSACDSSTFR